MKVRKIIGVTGLSLIIGLSVGHAAQASPDRSGNGNQASSSHPTESRGANLRGVELAGANLRGVEFTGANLRGVELTGADLSPACLGPRSDG